MFDAEARGTPEGIVKIPRLGSETEKKTLCMLAVVVVIVDSNPAPHGNCMIVLDALNHQRWRLRVLPILKVLGRGCDGGAGISLLSSGEKGKPRRGVRTPIWVIAHLGFIPRFVVKCLYDLS